MTLYFPQEVSFDREKVFPFLGAVEKRAEELFGPSAFAVERATSMYQLLELLAIDGRLDRQKILGDVGCLDVSAQSPEIAVFDQLGSKSLVVAEGHQGRPSVLPKLPEVKFIPEGPTETLRELGEDSLDLATIFNAYSDDLRSKEERAKLIHALARTLKAGGHFVVTGDGTGLRMEEIQAFEKEIGFGATAPSLEITLPGNLGETMGERGWIMRSILMEEAIGFDFDRLGREPPGEHLDAYILVAKKVKGN
jgi:hypothetical protein